MSLSAPVSSTETVCVLCYKSTAYKDLHTQKPVAAQILEDRQLQPVWVHHVCSDSGQHAHTGRAGTSGHRSLSCLVCLQRYTLMLCWYFIIYYIIFRFSSNSPLLFPPLPSITSSPSCSPPSWTSSTWSSRWCSLGRWSSNYWLFGLMYASLL